MKRLSAVLTVLLAVAAPAAAQQPGQRPASQAGASGAREADGKVVVQTVIGDEDAVRTRDRLRQILRQYPPSLADILRLDPTLLSNDAYLAPYPELAAFLKQHPGVVRNPSFFVGAYHTEWNDQPQSASRDAVHAAENVAAGTLVLTGVIGFMTLVGWAFKKLIDHRRWLRMSKIQTDAHAKVFERLSSSEDFLAYIQSPAGQKYLESAPLTVDERSLGAPIGRILFAAQVGTVVTFLGVALAFASSHLTATNPEIAEAMPFFFTASVLAIALGVGFIASAGVAYLLSRRLGLLEPQSSIHA